MPTRPTKATAEHQATAWRGMAAHGHRFGAANLVQALGHPLASRIVRMHAVAIANGHQPYSPTSGTRRSKATNTAPTGKAAACGADD